MSTRLLSIGVLATLCLLPLACSADSPSVDLRAQDRECEVVVAMISQAAVW